jgi:hypothetical protein
MGEITFAFASFGGHGVFPPWSLVFAQMALTAPLLMKMTRLGGTSALLPFRWSRRHTGKTVLVPYVAASGWRTPYLLGKRPGVRIDSKKCNRYPKSIAESVACGRGIFCTAKIICCSAET